LVAFAAWLPDWMDAIEARQPQPAPPYPLEGRDHLFRYGWSRAAWATYRAFRQVIDAARARQGARPEGGN
jgi:hypothetical protein